MKGRGFRGGSDERMWLGLEIIVAGLPSLDVHRFNEFIDNDAIIRCTVGVQKNFLAFKPEHKGVLGVFCLAEKRALGLMLVFSLIENEH